ncbi:MAG: hypothetical protein AAFQ83_19205 [Bacteroidota bacterium]
MEKKQKNQRSQKSRRETIEEKQNRILEQWLYLEQEALFTFPRKPIRIDKQNKIIQLRYTMRSTGTLSGTWLDWNPEEHKMTLEVEQSVLSIGVIRNSYFEKHIEAHQELIGQPVNCTLWPTRERQQKEIDFRYPHFKLGKLRQPKTKKDKNQIESIGKLTNIWEEGFELELWSPRRRRFFYTYVTGSYPYPDEAGEFVWVQARFNPSLHTIELVQAEAIAFVGEQELQNIRTKAKK